MKPNKSTFYCKARSPEYSKLAQMRSIEDFFHRKGSQHRRLRCPRGHEVAEQCVRKGYMQIKGESECTLTQLAGETTLLKERERWRELERSIIMQSVTAGRTAEKFDPITAGISMNRSHSPVTNSRLLRHTVERNLGCSFAMWLLKQTTPRPKRLLRTC